MAEKTKNKRIKIVEAEVVDTAEVELTDLLSASSKAEKAILDLCDKCLAFRDQGIKKMALQLKARAAALTQALSNLEITGDISDTGDSGEQLGSEKGNIDSRNLDNEGNKGRLESVRDKYMKKKKLKESDLELEAEEHSDEPKIDSSAKQELNKEEKVIDNNTIDQDKHEGDNEAIGESDKVVIDLSEPFEQLVKGLDDSEFQTFKSNVVSCLENSIDSIESKKDSNTAEEFTRSIEALNATQSVEDFDMGLDQVYDFADEHDILVETINKKK